MFKKLIDSVSGKLNETAQKIKTVIKENDQYIDLLEKVVEESKEGITALINYATIETPSLGAAINSLADLLTNIENSRAEKVAQLRERFIGPLNDLVGEAGKLNDEVREADNARKELEKAEKNLEKEKKKKAKGKPANVTAAEEEVKLAKANLEKEQVDVENATQTFNKAKLSKLQEVIHNLTEIEKGFHEKIMGMLNAVKEKANAINVDEESKIIETLDEE